MVLETTQLLNNALIKHNSSYDPVYRQTHKNHPASVWASESRENFNWLLNLGLELAKEYTFRYGKIHKCQSIMEDFMLKSWADKIPNKGLTEFVKCMPDQYKIADPIESYRNYYRADKAYIAKWKNRNPPEWWLK